MALTFAVTGAGDAQGAIRWVAPGAPASGVCTQAVPCSRVSAIATDRNGRSKTRRTTFTIVER